MSYKEALDKYLVNQVSIYPPFFSPLWIKTSNFNPSVYSEKIYYYENVLFHPDQVVLALENSDLALKELDAIGAWRPWYADDNVSIVGEKKTTNEKNYLTSSSEVQFVFGQIKNSLTFVGDHYATSFGIDFKKQSPIEIAKQTSSNSISYGNDLITEKSSFSAIMFLNNDYVGEGLVFKEQGVTVNPTAGSIVVFPSERLFYPEFSGVSHGEKYISSAIWIKP